MRHLISMELENLARRVLKTGRGGFGHVASADYIDMPGGAFHVVISVLAPFYKDANDEYKAKISGIIHEYRDLSDKRVTEDPEKVKKLVDDLERITSELERL
ncbi:hypothetical protein RGU11_06645 [Rossellomorea marisflavi]|uniref:hypothetical protein n=1 Tax=Rossellomorea marisflavi TaxID=189381 RepID=UPI00285349D7|nr:hypothetical protein [Rossellomorea marisflavi]MDR4936044.1 hypothetical protein [Rossellomorea marisflavi]